MVGKHSTHLSDVHCGDVDRAHLKIKIQTLFYIALQDTAGFQVVGKRAVAVAGGFFREIDRLIERNFLVAAQFAYKR